jgi:hypothetical protein
MTLGTLFLLFLVWVIFVWNVVMIGYMVLWIFKKTIQAPYVSSFNKDIRVMRNKLHLKSGLSLIDLWCWDGKAMRFFASTYWMKCVWFDINFYAITLGKIINYFSSHKSKIRFYMKNFMEADLSTFDYIYVYLLPPQLASIESRLWENKKKDSVIITNTFLFAKHKPFERIENEKWKKVINLYK